MGKVIAVLVVVAVVAGGVGAVLLNKYYLREKKAQSALAMGQGLESQEDYELALEEYQQAFQLFAGTSKGPLFLHRAASCLRELGRLSDAYDQWSQFCEVYAEDPLVPDVLTEMAFCAETMGNEEQAEELYSRIKENYPGSLRVGDALAGLGAIAVGQAKPEEAKGMLMEVLERFPGGDAAQRAMEALGKANMQVLFSYRPQEGTARYDVKRGDSLASIAKQFNTTVALLKEMNGLTQEWIRPGQTLKVVTEPLRIEVDISERTLTLYLGDEFFKRYPVGVGQYESTPIGEFEIVDKIENPTWYPPDGGVYQPGDDRNVLGTRWLAINKPHYGIHGTTEPDSIGKALSAGCVRMLNADVEELAMMVPVGTPVKIVK